MKQDSPVSEPPATTHSENECRWYPLPSLRLIRATGEDRISFLHGQLTRDLNRLGTGQGGMAAWCNPKGRVIASLLLVRQPEYIDLIVSGDLLEQVVKRLRMFVLRSRVELAVPENIDCIGLAGELLPAAARELIRDLVPETWSAAVQGKLTAVRMPGAIPRLLIYGPAPELESLARRCQGECAEGSESGWMLGNIAAGLPWIDAGLSEQFLPQMLNLDQIGGLDFNKGCYPGQEVIARLHYRGEVKQRLRRGTSEQNPEPGMALYTETGERAGTIVNCAHGADGRWHCLAVATVQAERLRLDAADGPAVEFVHG